MKQYNLNTNYSAIRHASEVQISIDNSVLTEYRATQADVQLVTRIELDQV